VRGTGQAQGHGRLADAALQAQHAENSHGLRVRGGSRRGSGTVVLGTVRMTRGDSE
jgi:hypothetical protein